MLYVLVAVVLTCALMYGSYSLGGEVKIFFNSKTSAEFTATEEW